MKDNVRCKLTDPLLPESVRAGADLGGGSGGCNPPK